MNERIKELMEQSGMISTKNAVPGCVWTTGMSLKTAEKFAELIVQECTNMLRAEMYRLDAIPGREVSAQTMETAQVLIKKYFGVK